MDYWARIASLGGFLRLSGSFARGGKSRETRNSGFELKTRLTTRPGFSRDFTGAEPARE